MLKQNWKWTQTRITFQMFTKAVNGQNLHNGFPMFRWLFLSFYLTALENIVVIGILLTETSLIDVYSLGTLWNLQKFFLLTY